MNPVTPFVRRQFATLSILFSVGLSVGLMPQSAAFAAISSQSVALAGSSFIEDRFYYSDATYTTLVGHSQTNFCTHEVTTSGQQTQFYKTKYTRCYY